MASNFAGSKRKGFYLLALTAVILRLSVFGLALAHPERVFESDSNSYIVPAIRVVEDGGYTDPNAARTPAYPLLIAGIYAIFGARPVVVTAVQVLIGMLNVFLTYQIGRQIVPQGAWLGVLLLLFALESIVSTFFVLSETLFTLLLLLAMFALLKYRQTLHWGWIIVAGLSAGLSVLCRPVAIYFLPGLGFLFALIPRSRHVFRLYVVAGFLGLALLVVFPWILRNKVVIGSPMVSSISADYLLTYEAASLQADIQGTSLGEAQQALWAQLDETLRQSGLPGTEANVAKLESHLAREVILSSPFRFVYVHLREDVKNLLPGTSYFANMLVGREEIQLDAWETVRTQGWKAAMEQFIDQKGWVLVLMLPFIVLLVVMYAGSALGVWRLARDRDWFVLAYLLLPVLYFMLVPGASSNSRFRVPVMPYIGLLASWGLCTLRLPKRKTAPPS
jgi:4-amino-4-deoxy-L-arabinose transferase-like glycosyltransferase